MPTTGLAQFSDSKMLEVAKSFRFPSLFITLNPLQLYQIVKNIFKNILQTVPVLGFLPGGHLKGVKHQAGATLLLKPNILSQ